MFYLDYEFNEIDEIDFRLVRTRHFDNMAKIQSAQGVAHLFRYFYDEDKIGLIESMYCLLLNRANKLLSVCELSQGASNATLCDVKLVFGLALRCQASAVILCHNHPSGNPTPSEADFKLTEKMIKAGAYFDLPILDHIILTPEKETYYSMAEQGDIIRLT